MHCLLRLKNVTYFTLRYLKFNIYYAGNYGYKIMHNFTIKLPFIIILEMIHKPLRSFYVVVMFIFARKTSFDWHLFSFHNKCLISISSFPITIIIIAGFRIFIWNQFFTYTAIVVITIVI